MASSDQAKMYLELQAAKGSYNAATSWEPLRILSEGLVKQGNTIDSAELVDQVGETDAIPASSEVGGPLSCYMLASETFEQLMRGPMGANWAADVLAPGNVDHWFQLEKRLAGASGTLYHRFLDVTCASMAFGFSPDAPFTLAFQLIGGTRDLATSALAGAVADAAIAPPVDEAPVMVGKSVSWTWGSELDDWNDGAAILTALQVTIDRQNSGVKGLGVDGFADVNMHKLQTRITGTVVLTTNQAQQAWDDGAETTLQLVVPDLTPSPDNHTYTFDFARVKLRQAQAAIPGTGDEVAVEFEAAALVPPGGDQVTITRATA